MAVAGGASTMAVLRDRLSPASTSHIGNCLRALETEKLVERIDGRARCTEAGRAAVKRVRAGQKRVP